MARVDTKWADIDAGDEDSALDILDGDEYVTGPDEHGIKTMISYTHNAKGDLYKLLKRIKIHKHVYSVNKAVDYRKTLVPFYNKSQGDTYGRQIEAETSATRSERVVPDEVAIEHLKHAGKSYQHDDDDEDYLNDPVLVRDKREIRSKFKTFKETLSRKEFKREDETRLGRYHDVGTHGLEKGRQAEQNYKDDSTIRVTNIADSTSESDLRLLFGRIGAISRVFLAKERDGTSKGFAFITYSSRKDAVEAIRKLNRHGYENLVLNVEWAKPSVRER